MNDLLERAERVARRITGCENPDRMSFYCKRLRDEIVAGFKSYAPDSDSNLRDHYYALRATVEEVESILSRRARNEGTVDASEIRDKIRDDSARLRDETPA